MLNSLLIHTIQPVKQGNVVSLEKRFLREYVKVFHNAATYRKNRVRK